MHDESETPHPGQEGTPDQTQKLTLPLTPEPPLRTQKISLPAGTAGQTQAPPPPAKSSRRAGWKVPVALGVAILLGGAIYLLFTRSSLVRSPAAAVAAPEAVAPGAQTYLDQAKTGDAHAMRMLGVMYYYGLNVPQDREKGLYWYRKAAATGSDAARAELSRLEAAAK
ncbi:MAG TPA: SEL1-like repeat protein [Geothrix sp.]|jgi:hypothetical protein